MAGPQSPSAGTVRPRRRGFWARLSAVALWAPFPALLWVGSYADMEPRLLGFPLFYWYQFVWVFLSSGFTWCAYLHGGGRAR